MRKIVVRALERWPTHIVLSPLIAQSHVYLTSLRLHSTIPFNYSNGMKDELLQRIRALQRNLYDPHMIQSH